MKCYVISNFTNLSIIIPGAGRGLGCAALDWHHEVVERAGKVLEDQLDPGLLQPFAQFRLSLLLEADDGKLLTREKSLHLRARLFVVLNRKKSRIMTNLEIIL